MKKNLFSAANNSKSSGGHKFIYFLIFLMLLNIIMSGFLMYKQNKMKSELTARVYQTQSMLSQISGRLYSVQSYFRSNSR